MNLIIWLVVGGLVGWVASIIMRTDAQQGLLLNVVVGIVGALIAGLVVTPRIGGGTINSGDFSAVGVLISLLGSILLLISVHTDDAKERSRAKEIFERAGAEDIEMTGEETVPSGAKTRN